jgi:hypothetical protein
MRFIPSGKNVFVKISMAGYGEELDSRRVHGDHAYIWGVSADWKKLYPHVTHESVAHWVKAHDRNN